MGKKTSILNRDNINLAVQIDEPKEKPIGTAFLAHGLGGFMEQKIIHNFMDVFLSSGYQTVRWDAANTIGESGGKMEEVTATSYIQDLEDIINWAKKQSWFSAPIVLCGHSLGGISSLVYAENTKNKVHAVITVASVISGRLSMDNKGDEFNKEWKEQGYWDRISNSKPGTLIRTPWKYAEDLLQYDTIIHARNLTMPVYMIVGDKDDGTPAKHQKLLFDAIPHDNKEIFIVKGAMHNFRTEEEIRGLKEALANSIYNFETANS